VSVLGRCRQRLVNAALGVDLQALMLGYQDSLARLEISLREREDDISFLRRRLESELEGVRAQRDDIAGLQAHLRTVRSSTAYSAAFELSEPLVTVRIASYARTKELMEVAIPSVLAQTYQNLELIIVNDGPNPATRRAVVGLADPRVLYDEFAERNSYPADARSRWMVAGSPGMNRGAELANGTWIAPLDEDDAFTPDHIEKLLSLARAEHAELAYGALIQRNLANGTESRIWSAPPAISQFSFQGALYLRMLHPIFRYDESSWLVDEPGDWNLVRRMSAAGVTMASTRDVVAIMNQIPYTHKAKD
jgi:hypothetical protein